MDITKVKTAFTAEERELALRRAMRTRIDLLIELALVATGYREKIQIDNYTTDKIKFSLRRSLILKDKVLIELVLGISKDISGLETSIIKHKIRMNDVQSVEKLLNIKSLSKCQFDECAVLALKEQNKEMVELLLERGASQVANLNFCFQMGDIRSLEILIDAGCTIDFKRAIKNIIDGCSGRYAETIIWLFEQIPDESVDVENFKKMLRYARTYGKYHIASHMEKCMESYREKFISVEEP